MESGNYNQDILNNHMIKHVDSTGGIYSIFFKIKDNKIYYLVSTYEDCIKSNLNINIFWNSNWRLLKNEDSYYYEYLMDIYILNYDKVIFNI